MKKQIFAIMLTVLCVALMLTSCSTSYNPHLPTSEQIADISVEKIEGLPKDFVKGVDISSLISLENAGVKFYDKEGKEQDIFKILADAGVNYLRLRVWNNPFDANGNGYGGGNCDVDNAHAISLRAKKYNLKLCIDFHYSDFWADPSQQLVPKAWKSLTTEQKGEEIYNFTLNSLKQITLKGAPIGMVQIGNEINNGMCGETVERNVMKLLTQASKAVRDFATQLKQDTKIALHFTDIQQDGMVQYKAKWLSDNNLDYDIFGVSYYSYWHGSMQNLTECLKYVSTTYGKQTMVLETAYMRTIGDGDGHINNVGINDIVKGYPATTQGQANNLRDVINATHIAGGIGVFYWEPAWIPVGKNTQTNALLWEQWGCGWASSYAGEYDPNNAGKWYGGSSWDNQALFDYNGQALPSLDVFKYVNFGAIKK